MGATSQPMLFDGPTLRADWPWGDLRPGAYGLIMADPPWRFELYSAKGESKAAQAHYATMSLDVIAALTVAELSAPDSVLWLWATAPMLHRQMAIAEAWGFEIATTGAWVKTTRRGKIAFGTGYVLRNAHEPFVIATRGQPRCARTVRSVVMGEAREHSRKPDAAFAAAEHLLPGVARVELFSRETRPGWDSWGNEAGKFDGGRAGAVSAPEAPRREAPAPGHAATLTIAAPGQARLQGGQQKGQEK